MVSHEVAERYIEDLEKAKKARQKGKLGEYLRLMEEALGAVKAAGVDPFGQSFDEEVWKLQKRKK